jgi:hypothetical protein
VLTRARFDSYRLSGGSADVILSQREATVKKLKLNVDALAVDSFEATPEGGDAGTVHGHDAGYDTSIKVGCWCTETGCYLCT